MDDKLPTPEEFLLNIPLYKEFKISENDARDVLGIQYFAGKIDAFCTKCNRETIFSSDQVEYPSYPMHNIMQKLTSIDAILGKFGAKSAIADTIFPITLTCNRDKNHHPLFLFKIEDKAISKIGQTPSIADFQTDNLSHYKSILKNYYSEFRKAIGLVSHGIGIGAFVYLRRIFENLINEVFDEHIKELKISLEEFNKLRMDEKISVLKNNLPVFLVENKSIYSILSKGIHSLSEDECLKYFDTVKIGIELILDERIEKNEKQKKIDDAKKAIDKINSSIK